MPVENFRVGEMLNKRTPNTKTWINFDGSYTTEIYQGLVHYQDASGNLHNINTDLFDEADFNEIDFPVAKDGDSLFYEQKDKAIKDKKKNRLNRENYDFQGLKVPYEVKIPRNIRRGYSIGKGTSKLKFIPVDASVSKGYVEGNKITYQDVWNDADLVLELLPEGIKETIILKSERAPINFSFEVQGELSDELKIQPMWLQDAEGTKRDVLQGVSEIDEKIHLDIAADTSNLVYPIEIDPTVTIQPDGTVGKDARLASGSGGNTNYPVSDLGAGRADATGTIRSLVQFDLSSIPTNSYIVTADLLLYLVSYGTASERNVSVHKVLASWIETGVTWNNQPSHDVTAIATTKVADQGTYNGGDVWPYFKWNVKTAVQDWANGSPNYGLKMVGDEIQDNSHKNFGSSDTTTVAQRPKLTVVYNQPPTAPVVTAPNGGETWNSSHTVTWTGAKDTAEIDTGINQASSGKVTNTTYRKWAQTFTNQIAGTCKEVQFYIYGMTTAGTLRVHLYSTDTNGKPLSSLVYTDVNITSGAIKSALFNYSLSANTKYAIMFEWVSGDYSIGQSVLGGVYSGGDAFDGNTLSSLNVDLATLIKVDTVTNLQYQIQLSTDNGANWSDIVALTAAGVTSYVYDFINKAETSTAKIRIRAYDGSAYGPWDESNGVFTIVHNQAPTAPTGLSPSGIPKDRAAVIRFAWLHNDPNSGDPQSKSDLQWRLQGSGTWNTVTQATTNNYYDMPSNTLPKGTIEWQVRTYDQAGLPSPYSALQVFVAGDKPPTPIFVSPANGSTVAVSKPVVQWSSVDQTGYEVKVLDAAGANTLWTTGQVNSTNKAVTVGMDLENETNYRIQVLVKGAEGIWSDVAASNINVSYTPPSLPIITTIVNDAAGTITVNIDNPLPVGTEPTVLYNDLFRLEPGGVWERIATIIPADGFYTDYTVSSDKNYQYKVVVVGDNETVRESAIISNSVSFKGIYLHVTSDPLSTSYQFKNDSEGRSSKWNLNHTFHKFAGRNNLVIDTEDSSDYGVDFSLKLKTPEELAALERIIYSQEVVCYRDGRGRKVFGVFTGFPLEDATWGESTSLNLMKIDYKEEIL